MSVNWTDDQWFLALKCNATLWSWNSQLESHGVTYWQCVLSTAPAHWGNPHLCLKTWITSLSEFLVETFVYLCGSTSTIIGAYFFHNKAYCHLWHTAKMSNNLVVSCGCQSPQSKGYSLLNWYDCVLLLNGLLEFIIQVCNCGPWHPKMFTQSFAVKVILIMRSHQ